MGARRVLLVAIVHRSSEGLAPDAPIAGTTAITSHPILPRRVAAGRQSINRPVDQQAEIAMKIL